MPEARAFGEQQNSFLSWGKLNGWHLSFIGYRKAILDFVHENGTCSEQEQQQSAYAPECYLKKSLHDRLFTLDEFHGHNAGENLGRIIAGCLEDEIVPTFCWLQIDQQFLEPKVG